MKLVTVSEMRAIEQEADASGLTYARMMENAGRGLAKEILRLAYNQGDDDMQVLGLVGPGNNGGDTLVALAFLAEKGWQARAYLIQRKEEGDPLVERLIEAGGEIVISQRDDNFEQLKAFMGTSDVLLDGILGTGFKLPLKDGIAQVMAAAKEALAESEWPAYVVAVDCPSGVDCDTGEDGRGLYPRGCHADDGGCQTGAFENAGLRSGRRASRGGYWSARRFTFLGGGTEPGRGR